jgi:hypothetical protein
LRRDSREDSLGRYAQTEAESGAKAQPQTNDEKQPAMAEIGLVDVVGPFSLGTAIGAIRPVNLAGPPFEKAHSGPQMRGHFAFNCGPHHFFVRNLRSDEMSRIVFVSNRHSLLFSNVFSRLASSTVMPMICSIVNLARFIIRR